MPPTSGMPIASSGTASPTTSMSGRRVKQLPERDRDLAASEVRAEAEVRSRPTEADVRVGIAQHVEAFGIVEHARVTVGDAVEQHDLVAFRELVVADGRRLRRGAPHEGDG